MSKDDSFEALEKQLAKDALEKALKGVPPRKPRNKIRTLQINKDVKICF